jgi:periplasmic protein TonB
MWDRTLIESKGFGKTGRRWWTVPLAAGLHVALILIAIFASYWHVEAIEAPFEKMSYVVPVVITSPPDLGGRPNEPIKPARVTKTAELTQPEVVPPLQTEPPAQLEQFAPECETCNDPTAPPGPGMKDGVEGGDPTANGTGLTDVGIQSDDVPKVITPGMSQPVLISRVEPEYPRAALTARAQGMVILEAVITKTGTVEQIKTLRSDNAVLEKAAIKAVLQWKYRPAIFNSRPVKVYFTVTVIFKLK